MKHIDLFINYIKRFFSGKLILILFSFIVIVAVQFMSHIVLTGGYKDIGLEFSAADFVLSSFDRLGFYFNMIMIPFLLIFIGIRRDFYINDLIRCRSKSTLFKYQFFTICIVQTVFAAAELFISVILGRIQYKSLINFDEAGSYFVFENNGAHSNISFFRLCLLVFLFAVLVSVLINSVLLLLNWAVANGSLALVAMIALFAFDVFGKIGAYRIFGISYEQLVDYNWYMLLLALAGIAVIFAAGMLLSSRKDFLNVK